MLERGHKSFGGVSHDHVIYASAAREKVELQRVFRPMIVEERAPNEYPTGKQFSIRSLPPAEPLPDSD